LVRIDEEPRKLGESMKNTLGEENPTRVWGEKPREGERKERGLGFEGV
jgi:hypothetical protein